jgi:hypothetical protein
MRKTTLLTFLLLGITFTTVQAQQKTMSNELFEEYLEEKVRNPEIVEFLMKAKNFKDLNGTLDGFNEVAPEVPTAKKPVTTPLIKSGDRDSNVGGGAEPYITMNSANPNQLAASYMESGSAFDYPVFYSTDGGTTWTQSTFSPATELANQFPGDQIWGGGDPTLAFDDNGDLHMTWIYLHGSITGLSAGMFYASSNDGGVNFQIPAQQSDHVIHDGDLFAQDMIDRQWMDVDNTGGTYDGNLYMSAVYFGGVLGPGGEVVFTKTAASTGFSLTPGMGVPFVGQETTQFGNVKVDNNGTVHMACMRIDGNGDGGVYYVQSTDGAATFSTPVMLSSATTSLPNSSGHLVHDRDNSATSMAVDGNNVYVAWSDMASADIRSYYAYSNDGGATWSSPIEYGVVAMGANYYHLMPNLAADSGRVSLSWYAVNRNTKITDYYVIESPDAGASLGNAYPISASQTDFTNPGQDFYGDYNSSVRSGCYTHSIWSDGRTGSPNVYVAKTNTCLLTGVSEYSPLNGGFQVGSLYPNPAIDQATVNIDVTEADKYTIELLGVDGKLIQTVYNGELVEGEHQIRIDLSKVAKGNYVVKVADNDHVFATRILIKS